ncbi:methylated-DNA--[protein]-cysteine S-methyltransferase [Marinobacterium sediminicola]|uniref:Methylated-DNA--protein-cysteine methyltransferase n=1 Tax=Marinobacterium sediminicola TaxID=518898 RepID=A0ABY1RYF4_9GAMM|nr:methylated-DNA--[protein]-cysteine S-methyltransferase [Marinobacterium sediminicola]ULG68140.1 methylated-DNA--[protein]-cysteine S-methyltransferase [Marinobacterium sediminicola]SMR73347.1 methylated-DNA-[protein]-cysteine S-methyltransferase [Marinobacterium sediminicola]
MIYTYVMENTPVGSLTLQADTRGLCRVDFGQRATVAANASGHPVLDQAVNELEAYFRGERTTFDIPLAPVGTAFQGKVWDALQAIPYGEVRSYADIAKAIGSPQASRAVGMANNRNPISIIIPCHRVVGTNGSLTGYGGGLETKIRLLELEQVPLKQADTLERYRVMPASNTPSDTRPRRR